MPSVGVDVWEDVLELSEYDTPAHYLIRKNAAGHERLNLVIPLMKHKECLMIWQMI